MEVPSVHESVMSDQCFTGRIPEERQCTAGSLGRVDTGPQTLQRNSRRKGAGEKMVAVESEFRIWKERYGAMSN